MPFTIHYLYTMKANTQYQRVIPRDLFNESKLLKCVGRLCLLIHDGLTPVKMSIADEDIEQFEIGLLDDYFLTVANLDIFIDGIPFLFKTTYNSTANYPLYLEHEYCDYLVFDESGNFADEFINFCKELELTAQ